MVGFFDMHNLTFVDASRRIPLRFSAIQIQFGVESGLGRTQPQEYVINRSSSEGAGKGPVAVCHSDGAYRNFYRGSDAGYKSFLAVAASPGPSRP
jgi:hypothetical protein